MQTCMEKSHNMTIAFFKYLILAEHTMQQAGFTVTAGFSKILKGVFLVKLTNPFDRPIIHRVQLSLPSANLCTRRRLSHEYIF